MPGKCKFQDSWLAKDVYKDWLVKDVQDIHFARCRACCKSIKLQTMGEAALTSHAGGAGHKAAVRKLLEGGSLPVFQTGEHLERNDRNLLREFTISWCDNCFIAVCSDGLIVMWRYRWCVCVWLHQSRQECKNICPRTSGHQDITEHSCTVYAISELIYMVSVMSLI